MFKQAVSIVACSAAIGILATPAQAVPVAEGKGAVPHVEYPDIKHIEYRFGPLIVQPGQASIKTARLTDAPRRAGYITRFEANLVSATTNKPVPVDVAHIHHATWAANSIPAFSGGEEKSIVQFPRGFGMRLSGKERWGISHMIHNFTSRPEQVYLTWDIDFVPIQSAAAKYIIPVLNNWLNVGGEYPYPAFDALRGQGHKGRYVFPDQARGAARDQVSSRLTWSPSEDVTLVYAMGHVHPGALFSSLYLNRNGRKRLLLRSRAKYFGTRDRFSYDMATTAPHPDWKIKVKAGDVLSLSVTLDTSQNSWFGSMGVMPVAFVEGHRVGGIDPFASRAKIPLEGKPTHLSLPENRNLGGLPTALPDPRVRPDGPEVNAPIAIKGFRYQLGDNQNTGSTSLPPTVKAGQRISFVNMDATRRASETSAVYHTITSCRPPCSETTGGTYPRADRGSSFDSGQLGFGVDISQGGVAANRNIWSTPRDLAPGTYTYFCRLHPFMRGAFRVKSYNQGSSMGTGWLPLPRGEGNV